MTIVYNIHDGSGVLPAGSDATAPLTGGASVENAPAQMVADLHRDVNALDGGSPSTMLVQEVEAALLMARAAARDSGAALPGPGAVDAGAAPT